MDSPSNDLMDKLSIISDELDSLHDAVTKADKKANMASFVALGAMLIGTGAMMGIGRLMKQLQPLVAMGQQMQQAMAPIPQGPVPMQSNGTLPTGITHTPTDMPLPKGDPVGNRVAQEGPGIPDVVPMPINEPEFGE